MGNCNTSRRKIPIPPKQGISTAIKNVVINDISESKKFRRSFSKGSIVPSSNLNINNLNIKNNEKENCNNFNIDNNEEINVANSIKSKCKSKEKIIGDFYIKNYLSNDSQNKNISLNNNISNSSIVKNKIETSSFRINDKFLKINNPRNITKNSCKCKIKNKIPRSTFNPNIPNPLVSSNISTRNSKIKMKKYNSGIFTYNQQINNENINILNNSILNSNVIYSNDIKLNNTETNKIYKCIKTIEGHSEKIVSMVELSNGFIATGSYDNKIKIWNLETLQCIKTILEEGNIFCLLEMEPNYLLSGTNKNTIQLYNLNSPENYDLIFSFKGHELWVNCLVKCSEYYFASGSNDAEIKIWDYKNKTLYRTLKGHEDCILAMIILKNKKICSGSADLTLRIWDWGLGVCEFCFAGHNKWIKCLCQLDKDDVIISGSDDMKIKIWKKIGPKNYFNNEWKVIKEYSEHKHSVRTLCKINEDTFASGSFDGSIKIWNLNHDEAIQNLEGHKSYVISVIKIKNGDLVSCSNDHTIKVWRNT